MFAPILRTPALFKEEIDIKKSTLYFWIQTADMGPVIGWLSIHALFAA
jgi:hypothetical protein